MSIEAMKQALEALERLKAYGNVFRFRQDEQNPYDQACEAIESLRQAIANEALNRMAENARELGLDYDANSDHRLMENAQGDLERIKLVQTGVGIGKHEQEPVAWLHTKIEGVAVPHRPADLDKHPDRWEALYRTPPPCPTCEALARTVMLDQTSHDNISPQRTWVGLTPADFDWLEQVFANKVSNDFVFADIVCVISAKLKGKNT